ncbi:FAD binding domain-containing protein [Mangrovibrevibacter kandeliae]|uniref:FAD binding domain-containing protein n=1 Tax=Mangrovibrevibacter kandeliae TaxID=2968473 RepID=UPI002118F9FC|nr:xanthine dehydrogenase family protein subunit M [Aurantimonas sp. CSK15Z-1]MCQ8780579.1 xanthine dehydrogenase family protein subunit M [Aurantimonas sp. CSK15Z-1]
MKPFTYSRAASLDESRTATTVAGAALLAGGTSLLDLAKCGVTEPEQVVDITRLDGLDTIQASSEGARFGALARMSRVAAHADVLANFPAVAQSLSLAASAQLRNMATLGGNLMQRTRCGYFRDPRAFPNCNKRNPGSGCAALGGVTRNHAVLGTSEACIASYPGDLATVLVAFDAVVHLGERAVPADDFFLLPGDTPDVEHPIQPGEVITAISIPGSAAAKRSTYLKVRDRQSYEFAAASAAVGLELEADGRTIRDLRVALGGVASKPWRSRAVEAELIGKSLTEEAVCAASWRAVDGAVPHGDNAYKIELAPRVVARAILSLGGLA